MPGNQIPNYRVYVGAYAEPEHKSIYYYSFNPSTKELSPQGVLNGEDHSSFQIIDENQRILYTTCNLSNGEGGVASYRIDPETKDLTLISLQRTGGDGPCYVSLAGNGRYLLTANYRGKSVSVLPVTVGGIIEEPAQVIVHQGSGPNADRQEGPHPHSIQPGPDGKFVYACDLGTDRIMVYRLDPTSGKLSLCHEVPASPGAGPRHMAFHPNAPYAYVINELDSTVVVYSYDANDGSLNELQKLSTLPEGFTAENTASDLHFSPCGRFLYGSNRGHDSIVVYQVDSQSGLLELVEHQSTQGKGPRNFAISPDGEFVIAANQGSGNLVVYARNSQSGKLSSICVAEGLLQPVCVTLI